MDQDSTHMVAASKVPMLKPSEFELWRMRIEQYIQMIDYAVWEVIENDATLLKTAVVEGVEKLKFNSIKDAKLLLEAVEKRFGFKACEVVELLDEKLPQKMLSKFLKSLSPEWNTHVLCGRIKARFGYNEHG
ncbi:hypothetical protein Tco_1185814 [Tanacetum coccineum]